MVIAASVIALLIVLLAPILLIRFRKRCDARECFPSAGGIPHCAHLRTG
jgi:hypothetical protein